MPITIDIQSTDESTEKMVNYIKRSIQFARTQSCKHGLKELHEIALHEVKKLSLKDYSVDGMDCNAFRLSDALKNMPNLLSSFPDNVQKILNDSEFQKALNDSELIEDFESDVASIIKEFESDIVSIACKNNKIDEQLVKKFLEKIVQLSYQALCDESKLEEASDDDIKKLKDVKKSVKELIKRDKNTEDMLNNLKTFTKDLLERENDQSNYLMFGLIVIAAIFSFFLVFYLSMNRQPTKFANNRKVALGRIQ